MNDKSQGVKILGLELENVKRVSVLRMQPAASGLTVIGGDNAQGKTSVLDAICFALGGEKFRPSNLKKDDGIADPYIKIQLSNGLVIERKGKNASLKVTDPRGIKSGQAILDSFVEELALNLPKFMAAKPADKAKYLLRVLGIETELDALEKEEQRHYNERETIGRIADQKDKYSKEMVWYDGVPTEPIAAAELLKQHQDMLTRNAENARLRYEMDNLKQRLELKEKRRSELKTELDRISQEIAETEKQIKSAALAKSEDESTAELEKQLAEVETTNAKVRANLDKQRAIDESAKAKSQYNELTEKVEAVRKRRKALLDSAAMPLPGLSVEKGELIYNGKAWDCMSSAEQLQAATAIVRALNPKCGFVLLDRLEQMDLKTLKAFGEWLESQGLQAIATRVSKGAECSIIIEDGRAVGQEGAAVLAPTVEDKNDVETSDDEIEGF